jgi:hypothetical protein
MRKNDLDEFYFEMAIKRNRQIQPTVAVLILLLVLFIIDFLIS